MNTFKKTGGFTLVELIIVIAILAILSSVAVAGYSSYIKKANNSAVDSFINNVASHAVLANAEAGGIGNIVFSTNETNKAHVDVKIYPEDPGFDNDFASTFNKAFSVTLTACKSDGTAATGTDAIAYYTFTATNVTAWANSDYASAGKTVNP